MAKDPGVVCQLTEKRRLLLITNRYPTEQKPYAGWYVKAHAEFFQGAGWDVHVDCYSPHPSYIKQIISFGRYIIRLIRISRDAEFDLVHAHWVFPSGFLGVLIGKLRTIPVVVTSHGAYIEEFDELNTVMKWVVRWVLRSVDVLVSVGETHAKLLTNIEEIPLSKIKTIDMGIDIQTDAPAKSSARSKLGLDQDRFLVMFIGNLTYVKGPDLLLEALALMKDDFPELRCVFVGQGNYREKLEELVMESGLSACVEFVGGVPHEQVREYLAAADICVVPSRREPFGLIPIEAMACGIPVVAADVGELSRNIEHTVNGLLFEKGNPERLAEALSVAIEDHALREELAGRGRIFAQDYDLHDRARQMLEIYDRLVGSVEGTP